MELLSWNFLCSPFRFNQEAVVLTTILLVFMVSYVYFHLLIQKCKDDELFSIHKVISFDSF